MRRLLSRAAAIAAFGASFAAARPSSAAGLFYADHGVRPLGRGGAFVAGADDAGAIAYNAAGLYDAGGQVLVDASWLHFSSDYTRVSDVRQVDPNTGMTVGRYRQTFPTVEGKTPFLPIPTIAVSFRPHRKWVIGFGAWGIYSALTSYPDTVNGGPAPQRYSLISLDGSALGVFAAGAAFAPVDSLRIGATVEMLAGVFNAQSALSGCLPDRFLCAPEEPSWDVLAKLSAGPIFAPTGSLGAIWAPHRAVRIGASFHLPIYVRTHATLDAKLPSTPVFENASQVGRDGHVAFDLPWTLRAGVEARPFRDLRIEAAFSYEKWSMHDAIVFTPDAIALKNVAGFPPTYNVPTVSLPRHFQDALSVHLGGEGRFHAGRVDVSLRAGASYETSAIPNGYTSVLTIDQNKMTGSLGASLHVKNLRVDVVYAHVFGMPVTVDPSNAKIPLISPVQANPPANPDTVNGGSYAARADVIGLGVAYTFDPQR